MKVCAKMVPKELTEEQKQRRDTICQTFWRGEMTFWAVSSQVMKHGSTNTTLKRSGKVHSGRLPSPHDQKNSVSPNQESKQCCWFFFIYIYIYILEGLFIVPTGQTVNEINYLEVLERLLEKVRWKQPKLFANNSWILYHNNAPAHMALSVREFLATKQIICWNTLPIHQI